MFVALAKPAGKSTSDAPVSQGDERTSSAFYLGSTTNLLRIKGIPRTSCRSESRQLMETTLCNTISREHFQGFYDFAAGTKINISIWLVPLDKEHILQFFSEQRFTREVVVTISDWLGGFLHEGRTGSSTSSAMKFDRAIVIPGTMQGHGVCSSTSLPENMRARWSP